MRNKNKALEAINILVSSDLGFDADLIYHEMLKLTPKMKDRYILDFSKLITDIYKIAHAEIASCRHEDWEKIKYEIIKNS